MKISDLWKQGTGYSTTKFSLIMSSFLVMAICFTVIIVAFTSKDISVINSLTAFASLILTSSGGIRVWNKKQDKQ